MGNVFRHPPYSTEGFLKTNTNCPNCKIKFEKEPSFFYGSMYISYALGVAWSIVVFLTLAMLDLHKSPMIVFALISTSIVFLAPYIYQLSKVIWASIFIKYRSAVDE